MTGRSRHPGLAVLAVLVALSGCSFVGSPSNGPARSPAAPTSSPTPSTATPTGGDTTTPAGESSGPQPFENLTVAVTRTACPADRHWEPAYHRTPLPPPERPATVTRETAVDYAVSYEAFALTYLAVEESGPDTVTATDEIAEFTFPDTEMRDVSTAVIADVEGGFVVRVAYTRVVDGDSRGTYTITYYLTGERTVRTETEGDVSPGPNPATSGVVQRC